MKTKILFLIMAFAAFIGCKNPTTQTQTVSAQDTTTALTIINGTDSAVTVYITLGSTSGCLQTASQIPYVTDTIGSLVGFFTLAANDSTIAYAPAGMGFNGNISFNTQPLNCATTTFPNGVNILEFIINNSYQAGDPQETVNISCVAGVNCLIEATFSGGEVWNASSLYPNVTKIFNRSKMSNSGLIGVFPFSCDTCLGRKNPPSCADNDQDKQINAICTVQRNAIGSNGGLVRVVYLGANVPTPLK